MHLIQESPDPRPHGVIFPLAAPIAEIGEAKRRHGDRLDREQGMKPGGTHMARAEADRVDQQTGGDGQNRSERDRHPPIQSARLSSALASVPATKPTDTLLASQAARLSSRPWVVFKVGATAEAENQRDRASTTQVVSKITENHLPGGGGSSCAVGIIGLLESRRSLDAKNFEMGRERPGAA